MTITEHFFVEEIPAFTQVFQHVKTNQPASSCLASDAETQDSLATSHQPPLDRMCLSSRQSHLLHRYVYALKNQVLTHVIIPR